MTRTQHTDHSSRGAAGALLKGAVIAACLVSAPVHAEPHPAGAPAKAFCSALEAVGIVPPACRDADEGLSPEIQSQIEALTRTVAPFHSYDVAVAAGWDTPISECVESPAGGMGYHVANLGQLGSGHLNLLRPQVLLYAPTADGSMAFQGVEYIIPADLWSAPEPPEFLGQSLRFNPNIPPNGIWALHVWVGTPNPDGLFMDFNPEVSCQFAPGAE